MALATLNAFNTGVDAAIDHGKEVLLGLMSDAGWKETAAERAQVTDYAKAAAKHMQDRQAQLDKLRGSGPEA